MARYRYGRFTGGDPLAPPFDVRAAVDALGADVMAGRSVSEALRELLSRGQDLGDGARRGLDDLRRSLQRRRDELRRSGRLGGALDRAREQLDAALDAERAALDSPDAPRDAGERHERLDAVPDGLAAAVRDLEDYDWVSPQAELAYRALRDELREQVLRQRLGPLAGARQDAQRGDEGQRGGQGQQGDQALKDLLADLNALLGKHARGEDTTEAFEQFMDRHGDAFGEDPEDRPKDVDELVDELARRAAAAERLLRSLSPEQRAELAALMAAAMADPDLAAELAALNENLRDLRPGMDWRSAARVDGPGDLPYDQAAAAVGELADMDDLAAQLSQQHPGATLDDVDVEAVERQLGSQAVADVRDLQRLERELKQQGWLERSAQAGDGLTLSPKALRRLGQSALQQVLAALESSRRGSHDERSAGVAGEPTGSWRAWRFGDEQPLDAVRTVSNAVTGTLLRGGAPSPATGAVSMSGRVTIDVDDFAVAETERRGSAAVALCVDLSWSMYAEGRWSAMKQTALALQHLVSTRFPTDALEVIGFDRWARRLTQAELATAEPAWVQGTNLAGALGLARAHLARHPGSAPVLLVVTDGEPTAHVDDSGEAVFDWPTTPATLRATLAEVDALTRSRVPISTFVLGDDPGLRRFVDAVARRNGGRVLAPSPGRLGEYVVDDYLRARRR